MRIAVNGFGRIGRLVTRILLTEMSELQVVAINDPAPVETQAYLLQYDSNYGPFAWPIRARVGTNGGSDRLLVGGNALYVGHSRAPEEMPWGHLGVDLVVDATGRLRKRADLEKHLSAGAQRVLVSAPSSGADLTL